MAKNTNTIVANMAVKSQSGSGVVRAANGKFMKVDGISRQNHRRYCDDGVFVTADGRKFILVPVVKALIDGRWTTKF